MKTKLLTTLILTVGLFLALMHSPAYADGITVNTAADSDAADSDCSLREAIVAANTDAAYNGCTTGSGADTITFAADYTITLNGSQLPAITSTLTISGSGAANTIIQAHAAPDTATHRVFEVGTAGNLTLEGVTVQNGRCAGACPTDIYDGGGIYNAGTLTVNHSHIFSNTARGTPSSGGGIYGATAGQSTVINQTHVGYNHANFQAGGIYMDQPITITNSSISYNSAAGGDGGGGIYTEEVPLLIEYSDIISNTTVKYGGGILLYYGWATIRHSRILSNTANFSGGGIYVDDGNSYGGSVQIENSEVAYNKANDHGGGMVSYNDPQIIVTNSFFHHNEAQGQGGGIWFQNPNPATITGTTIAYNIAHTQDGGGIYNQSPYFMAKNSTISHNQGQNGGGIYTKNVITLSHVSLLSNTAVISGGGLDLDGINAHTVLQNSLIAHNNGNDCVLETGASLDATPGYNLDSDGTCIAGGGPGNLTSATPGVGPLADNGGPATGAGQALPTHALLTGSPAIDVIPPGNCPLNTDQRGIPRPQGANCDIGAFERSQSFSLTISGGNSQSTTIGTAFASALQVTLVTSGTTIGQPGQVVTFTAPASGASLTQTLYTATTNSSGVASVTVTANAIAGTYVATATTQGAGQVALFNLTNTTNTLNVYLPLVVKN